MQAGSPEHVPGVALLGRQRLGARGAACALDTAQACAQTARPFSARSEPSGAAEWQMLSQRAETAYQSPAQESCWLGVRKRCRPEVADSGAGFDIESAYMQAARASSAAASTWFESYGCCEHRTAPKPGTFGSCRDACARAEVKRLLATQQQWALRQVAGLLLQLLHAPLSIKDQTPSCSTAAICPQLTCLIF